MDLWAVREAICAAASTVEATPPLRCVPQVRGTLVAPTLWVTTIRRNFDRAMNRGLDELIVTARVVTKAMSEEGAALYIDSLMAGSGAGSLKAAIESCRPLNGGDLASSGVADDLHVRSFAGHEWWQLGGAEVLGGELEIFVIGPGS